MQNTKIIVVDGPDCTVQKDALHIQYIENINYLHYKSKDISININEPILFAFISAGFAPWDRNKLYLISLV